jgi:hypothetical protein
VNNRKVVRRWEGKEGGAKACLESNGQKSNGPGSVPGAALRIPLRDAEGYFFFFVAAFLAPPLAAFLVALFID